MLVSLINSNVVFAKASNYDEYSFKQVFADPNLGRIVLEALELDPDNVDWTKVNDASLGSITYLNINGNVEKLDGLEKLTGLKNMEINETEVQQFPDGIENSVKDLKSLRIINGNNPIKIPKFASLTSLSCGSGQAISMDSKESIEGMTNLQNLNLNFLNNQDGSIVQALDYSKLQSSLISLNISSNDLQSVPESVYSLTGLKNLNIDGNNITSLPENFITNLSNLQFLNLSSCRFESIPSDVLKLKNLVSLDLSYNSLKSIPGGTNGIAQLNNLENLYLSGCSLDSFPTSVLDMENLTQLSLMYNNIEEVPGGADGIGKLKKLQYLDIDSCELNTFPDITQNSNLQFIYAARNKLKSIPDTIDLSNFPLLQSMSLDSNYFTSVPLSLIQYEKDHKGFEASLNENFIMSSDSSIESAFSIENQRQLSFLQLPTKICTNDKINLFNQLAVIDSAGEVSGILPELIDFTVTLDGKNTSNANISADGVLKITVPGTYLLTACIKGADSSNTLATVSASIVVSNDPNESEFYNEDRMNKEFPDKAFREEVLRRLGVDPENPEWSEVSEKRLAEINYFAAQGNEIKSVEGLSKLAGLKDLRLYDTSISNFPSGVEESLKNLRSLYIGGNINPLTVPKFVTLTELRCASGSGQSISVNGGQVLNKASKEAIEAMPNLKYLELNNNFNKQENYSVPENIDYSKLSQLEELDIGSNNISKLPNSILSLSNLQELYLDNNKVTLPESFNGKLSTLKALSLYDCGLNSIPKCVFELGGLNQLVLNGNKIKKVPKDIGKLANLTDLYLENCGLTAFPESILNLPNIFSLALSNNNIVKIPEEISKLNNLYYLLLSNCGLKKFPPQLLGNKQLGLLEIDGNNISSMPEGPNGMVTLPNLIGLNISNCSFNSFPSGVLDIKSLKILSIRNNKISNIPEGVNGISKLENLCRLDMAYCSLSTFPEFSANKKLYYLNLEHNNFLDIPDLKNTGLLYILLSDNYFTKVPQGVVDDINSNSTYYSFEGNYINTIDSSLEDNISYLPPKQLLFEGLPQNITVSDKIILPNYMHNEFRGGIEKSIAVPGFYEFKVTSNGKATSNASIAADGTLSFSAAGTYEVQAKIKGAEPSNKFAFAETTLTVKKNSQPKTDSGSSSSGKGGSSSSGKGNSSAKNNTNLVVEPEVKAPAVNLKTGIIATAVGNKTVCDIMFSNVEAEKLIKDKVFSVDVSSHIKSENALINIPAKLLSDMLAKGSEKLKITTPYGILSFNLKGIDLNNAKDMCLSIDKVDGSFTETQKAAAGKSNVLKLLLELKMPDGTNEKLGLGKMEVELPHNAVADEDTDILTVYSFTADGKINNLGGKYDPAKKAVVINVQNGSSIAVAANKASFSDLTQKHWANKFIASMAAKGIINGYNDGGFKPDGNITRAEFGVLIAKLLKLDTDIKGSSFTDVKDTDWFSKYIEAAVKAGIISGWDGKFKPNDYISRQDAAVILSKAVQYMNKNQTNNSDDLSFSDKDLISDYAASHIRSVAGLNIMSGKPGKLFDPKGLTKRGEVAKMLYVVFNLN